MVKNSIIGTEFQRSVLLEKLNKENEDIQIHQRSHQQYKEVDKQYVN